MIRAVIFDFDGVLVESVAIKTKAFERLFKSFGKDAVKKVVKYHLAHTGISRFDKFRYIYANILRKELSKEVFNELCGKFASFVTDEVVRAPYVAGAKEFLDKHTGYKFFISSATPQAEIEDIVTRRGMKKYFSGIYGSPAKKTDIVRNIISQNGFLPEEIVYVGDALSDYNAAKKNGIFFIARINRNEAIFDEIECVKVADLTGLRDSLASI